MLDFLELVFDLVESFLDLGIEKVFKNTDAKNRIPRPARGRRIVKVQLK